MNIDDYIEQSGAYLLSHSIGLPLKSAEMQLNSAFWDPLKGADSGIWAKWLGEIDEFRLQLAGLLGAQSRGICPQSNISSALTKILFSLPHDKQKTTIVLSETDFPTVGFIAEQATRLGYPVEYIPASKDLLDLNVWSDVLHNNVGVLLATHVQSNSGIKIPISSVLEIAKSRNIISIVDVAQSIGIVPIDVKQWQADFLVGSCVKWLCGGPGAGFLWVSDEIIDRCRPIDVGWFSHDSPFEFNIHNFRYASDALRYWGGTPTVQPFLLAAHSIKQINKIGLKDISNHNRLLVERLISSMDPVHLASPAAPENRGGTVVLNFKDYQHQVEQKLLNEKVRFDTRSEGIRLSPHIYNNESQIDNLVEIISSCITSTKL